MRVSIQKPTDQPTGNNRLLEQLRANLANEEFDTFRFIVAFAKLGPFLRLESVIKEWVDRNKKIEAIFGVDEKGTSLQALEFALKNFTTTHIAHFSKHSFSSTFHPKIYVFTGPEKGVAYIGSNNFTVGGLETNAESNVKIDFELIEDKETYDELTSTWESTFAVSRQLDAPLLGELVATGLVIDEKEMIAKKLVVKNMTVITTTIPQPDFPLIAIRPPSSIPRTRLVHKIVKEVATTEPVITVITQALVIQIVPHQNGEILLSKLAVDQNPEFFGFPFTGKTTPKKDANPSYPQKEPDPIVSVLLRDANDNIVLDIPKYPLNMVYYEVKSEIRITVPQEVIKNTPPYSIMLINRDITNEGLDYNLDIFIPGSDLYNKYLESCNQELPSGGKDISRKFGWI